ncbi:aromatic/alkene monooxygenase hydroxylase subunit beta [Acinetobacter sichuanensis]|uniref:Aromatic/alkene monooxygenase hydroxylase subunit beta n=1 Tax=Acinetobacter sichuanensis TaxID=2136183 RepID=A0A371YR15_9GAMM|nr:aromatic/alkene monooxygenase hydroxylase subunit beta [Acinetobacter sichuanensis]RFC83903.1 phenol hydroxylase [Acinetobacter sichuanensis]
MQIDIKTSTVQPIRNTYKYVEERFGDKIATRYQEASYDLQEEINFHYRPLFNSDYEIFDKEKTVIKMQDWYALKDPRQLYYGTYTLARSRLQEVQESNFTLTEKNNLLAYIPEQVLAKISTLLIPLRHYEWGANMNNSYITGEGYGAVLTNAAMFCTMDRLGNAQFLTRIGLIIGENQTVFLQEGKNDWLMNPHWQPLRKSIEELFLIKDWFELFVAQNFVLDGFIFPYVKYVIHNKFVPNGANTIVMLTAFLNEWFDDTSNWINAVLKTTAAESENNKTQLIEWIEKYRPQAFEAITQLNEALGFEDQIIDFVKDQFQTRLEKLKLV